MHLTNYNKMKEFGNLTVLNTDTFLLRKLILLQMGINRRYFSGKKYGSFMLELHNKMHAYFKYENILLVYQWPQLSSIMEEECLPVILETLKHWLSRH